MIIDSFVKKLIKYFIGFIMAFFGKFILKKELLTICYHDITKNPSKFSGLNELNLDPELFRTQLLFLKSNFNIISPDDLIAGKIPDRAVLITFDDGWKSTFDIAIPIMKELQIPSVIFLNMAPVKGELFFPGKVDYFLKNYKNFSIFLKKNIFKSENHPLHTYCTESLLKAFIKKEKPTNHINISNYIGDFASEKMLMKHQQDKYVYYGNHLMNHYVSKRLNQIEFKDEYSSNDNLLMKYQNYRKITAFPYGQPNSSFTQKQVKQLFDLGSQHVFSSSGCIFRNVNNKFIDRISFTSVHSNKTKIWQHLGVCFIKGKLSSIGNIK
jgi:hypothetical protein